MSQLKFHPAPGLGDLLPGWHVVPQNPIRDAGTALVPSVQAASGNRITRTPHVGDLLAASFVVPQNVIVRNVSTGMNGLAATKGIGCLGCSGCAGCEDGGNYYGMQGLGDTSITDWLTSPSFVSDSVPNWMLYGGAAALAWILLMPGGSEYRQKSRALRSQYRGYKRAGEALSNPRRKNVEKGFVDKSGVFHPIRGSYDYNAKRAGEKKRWEWEKKR